MREGLKDRPLAALLLARVMERMALQEGDLERLRLAREHKARAQQRLLESQNSVQTSTKLPDPERFDEPSPGRLFIDDFLDKNLVEFDECSAHYESMTPVELVDEMTFLFGRQTLAIRFELSSKRYYAFLDSLVHCAANNRDLTNHQRSQLVNMAIDVRAYVRNRTAEDWREAFDKALSAFGEQLKMRWLSGKHEPSYIKAQGNLGEMTKSHLSPFQIRSATGQHRRHGGVSGGGKGRGSRALVAGDDASAASTLEADVFSRQTLPCCVCRFFWRSDGRLSLRGTAHLTEEKCPKAISI